MCHDDKTGIRIIHSGRTDPVTGERLEVGDESARQGLFGLPRPSLVSDDAAPATLKKCQRCGAEARFGDKCAPCFLAGR